MDVKSNLLRLLITLMIKKYAASKITYKTHFVQHIKYRFKYKSIKYNTGKR